MSHPSPPGRIDGKSSVASCDCERSMRLLSPAAPTGQVDLRPPPAGRRGQSQEIDVCAEIAELVEKNGADAVLCAAMVIFLKHQGVKCADKRFRSSRSA
jgi:hypothetical protein